VAEPGDRMDFGSPTFFLGGRGPPTFKFRTLPKEVQVTQFVLGPLLKIYVLKSV